MNQILKPKKGYKFVKGLFKKYEEIPEEWEFLPLNLVIEGKNNFVEPFNFPEEEFELYSIPSYHESGNPEIIYGKDIHSNKFFVDNDMVLFGKINPDLPKIWFVSSSTKLRKIASTEFILLKGNSKADSKFLFYLAWSEFLYGKCKSFVSGTTPSRERVEPKAFVKIPVPVPSMDEQQKIATVLSNIDNLITNTQKIINHTKSIKKGLMQKLLVKGISHKKFKNVKWYFGKEIEIPEEWEITTLKKSCMDKKGSFSMGPFGSDIKTSNFVSKGIPVIRGINLTIPPFYDHEFVFLTEEKAEELKNSHVYSNDLIFTHRGTLGQVGIIPFNAKYKKYVISQSQMKCTCDKSVLLPEFAFIFFSSNQGQKIIQMYSTYFGVPHIIEPLTSLRRFLILLPPIDEQQKIVSIFSNIDSQIKSQIQYKEKLEKLKRSLMQKLLTGQVRVKI